MMADNRSREILKEPMSEVHEDTPSTVERAKVSKKRKRAMLIAIAFEKARGQGARLPRS